VLRRSGRRTSVESSSSVGQPKDRYSRSSAVMLRATFVQRMDKRGERLLLASPPSPPRPHALRARNRCVLRRSGRRTSVESSSSVGQPRDRHSFFSGHAESDIRATDTDKRGERLLLAFPPSPPRPQAPRACTRRVLRRSDRGTSMESSSSVGQPRDRHSFFSGHAESDIRATDGQTRGTPSPRFSAVATTSTSTTSMHSTRAAALRPLTTRRTTERTSPDWGPDVNVN
jgi:hypothetical protein